MLHEPTFLRYLPFEIQPKTWNIAMCLKAIVWVTAVRSARYAYISIYEVFCRFRVVRSATPLGRSIVGRLVPLISPSLPEGDDNATEYSSGWFSPSFGGDRWPTLAAAETFMSPTSSFAAEPNATTSCRHNHLRLHSE